MIDKLVTYLANYVRLFWAIAWRTLALSSLTAVLSGVGLGVLMVTNNWPPAFIEVYTPMIGLPITLLTGAYIVWKQSLRFAKQTVAV